MLTHVTLRNFGPLRQLDWDRIGALNLVIGTNGSGKTFLLKSLFCAHRAMEAYKRGDEPRSLQDILEDKLYWTFELNRLGNLMSAAAPKTERLAFAARYNEPGQPSLTYEIDRKSDKTLISHSPEAGLGTRSIFLPAKEILTLEKVVRKLRDEDKLFGFDETFYDLAKALDAPTMRGKNFKEFSKARKRLEEILGGFIDRDDNKGWYFQRAGLGVAGQFPISVTAEGIKKIGILDVLLGNRTLRPGATVYIDEPEANLHPTAITTFLEIIHKLSGEGIQFFLASHSYFVIKKLHLIAREHNLSIPVLMLADDGKHRVEDLKDGMPDNPIIDESVRLYEEEIERLMP
jgi:energy-coupling factor transporter ATP-binding protein EcfA2